MTHRASPIARFARPYKSSPPARHSLTAVRCGKRYIRERVDHLLRLVRVIWCVGGMEQPSLAAARHPRHTRPLDHHFTLHVRDTCSRAPTAASDPSNVTMHATAPAAPAEPHLRAHFRSADGGTSGLIRASTSLRYSLGCMARVSPHTVRRQHSPVIAQLIGIYRGYRRGFYGWRPNRARAWAASRP